MFDLSSWDYFQQMSRYIRQQIESSGEKNICAVGFGIAEKKGKIDLARRQCVRFYVKKKPRTAAQKRKTKHQFEVKESFEIPLSESSSDGQDQYGRKSLSPRLIMPTDVHQIGKLVGSTRVARLKGDASIVTTGVVVRWLLTSQAEPFWGVLTVAHGYESPVPDSVLLEKTISEPDMRIRDPLLGGAFKGKRYKQFKPPDEGVDLALIRVNPQDLVRYNIIEDLNLVEPVNVPTLESVISQDGKSGVALQAGSDEMISFDVLGVISDQLYFENVGYVGDLLHVKAAENAFVGGTSGSPYLVTIRSQGHSIKTVPVAIQVGADSGTSFQEGYAQSLNVSLRQMRRRIDEVLQPFGEAMFGGFEVMGVF